MPAATAHIVILGNPVDGFRYVGPFTTRDYALAWGETIDEEWWVAEIQPGQGLKIERPRTTS